MAKKKDAEPEPEDEPVILLAEPPTGRKTLTVAQQYERNMNIVAQRVRRVPWSKIAEDNGVHVRYAHKVFAAWRHENPTLREHDPIEIVDELLYGYQAMIEDLSDLAAHGEHTSAKVGALNTKLRAYREMAELLQAVGALPHDLGTMHLHIDGQITADRILTVLERFNVSPEIIEAMIEAVGGPEALRQLEAGDVDDAEVVEEP